jgi:hypothetical protein
MVDSVKSTFKSNSELEVLPTLYIIDLFLELPAALIFPLSFIFNPLIFSSLKRNIKCDSMRYFKKRKIDLVFQKDIRKIIVLSHLENNFESFKIKDRWIMCKDSSRKNL